MENAGAVTMVIVQLKLTNYDIEYVGDGDTPSFKDGKDSNPYQNEISIVERECIVHVQKRMGTRIRDLAKSKKEILPGLTRKGVDGKGRLSEKNINILQNYYGVAIRQNNKFVPNEESYRATLFHCSNLKVCHQFCPQSIHSWCKYQSDKLTSLKTYKAKLNLHEAITNMLVRSFSKNYFFGI